MNTETTQQNLALAPSLLRTKVHRAVHFCRFANLTCLTNICVVGILVFTAAFADDTYAASDRESEARKLFVEAAKITRSGPCKDMPNVSALMTTQSFDALRVMLLQNLFVNKFLLENQNVTDVVTPVNCLNHLKKAIHIQQRILDEFSETETAFHIAATGYVTEQDIDRLISSTQDFERLIFSTGERATGDTDQYSSEWRDVFRDLLESSVRGQNKESMESSPLSLSVLDSVRRQIEDKWNVPAGAANAGDRAVEIRILLMPDGKVRRAVIVDQARLSSDAFYRTMAESARRAVLQASPLRDLPPEKYEPCLSG
jgi:hypothetical protein